MISDRVSILRAKGQGGANSAGHRTSYVSIKKHEGNLRMLPPMYTCTYMYIHSMTTDKTKSSNTNLKSLQYLPRGGIDKASYGESAFFIRAQEATTLKQGV